MGDLELILTWLGMSKYLERFEGAGFDSWETILEVTEKDLEILNVDLGHRRKLQKEIANTKRLAQDPAFVTPLYGITPQQSLPRASISSSSDVPQVPSKRGYRHHPKPDSNAPERPYSAYVMFSNHTREQLKKKSLSFTELSRQVGERWQSLTREEKEYWKQTAATPWEKYKSDMAEYQKTEESREYQKYLDEFKTVQAAKNPEKKPALSQRQSPTSSRMPGSYRLHSRGTSKKPISRRQTAPIVGYLGEPNSQTPKVAIKRLKKEDDERWANSEGACSPRVRQACESCRQRKIKCYGEQPTCRHCRENGTECFYENGKRDQKKKQDENLWGKLKTYEELLLRFVSQVDDDDQRSIQDALRLPPQLENSRGDYRLAMRTGDSSTSSSHDDGELEASGIGSTGSTDHVNQDEFMHEEGQAFLGQASEARWMQSLRKELNPMYVQAAGQGLGSQNPNPYCEDMDTSIVGHQIDPFSLPLKSTADALVNSYFSTVHLSFPMINKAGFMFQYEQLARTIDPANYPDRTFISKLQLVFAIGAVHAHFTESDWAGDGRDHMLYFAQARMQAVETGILNDTCYLGQVQVFGLGCMYLLATDQINRAWNLNGLAIRSAQSLGLHLRDITSSLSPTERRLHAQIWFAIISLETMLTVRTGRPSMINDRDCSVSIAHALAEEERSPSATSPSDVSHRTSAMDFGTQASSGRASEAGQGSVKGHVLEHSTTPVASTYFMHYTEVCALAKEVVGELYRPGIRQLKWSVIQNKIENFDKRLLQWRESFYPPFNVAPASRDPEIESCRVALRILFHSTRTIINRPCLCRLEDRIADQSSLSKQKNRGSAHKCVDAARAVLDLILNKPESAVLHHGVMWWMLLHHLKRALTVLLLELAFRAEHMPANAADILAQAKQATAWLSGLGRSSPTARRTWITMSRLLYPAAQKVGGDTSDIVAAPEAMSSGFSPGSRHQHHPHHPHHPHQQQPPLQPGSYDGGNPNLFTAFRGYGGEGQYSGDLAARSELDQFGFLREEEGMGSFFPMGGGEGEDHEQMAYGGDQYFDFSGEGGGQQGREERWSGH